MIKGDKNFCLEQIPSQATIISTRSSWDKKYLIVYFYEQNFFSAKVSEHLEDYEIVNLLGKRNPNINIGTAFALWDENHESIHSEDIHEKLKIYFASDANGERDVFLI